MSLGNIGNIVKTVNLGYPSLRLEFQKITEKQTQMNLRLSWGSVHGPYCLNIELGGLT
jgi:hypothetical protein